MRTHRVMDSVGLAKIAFAGTIIGLALWAADDLKAWLQPHVARLGQIAKPVQVAAAIGNCRAPVEGEQLVVIFNRRDENVEIASCFFAGSRGTYSARAR